MSDTTLTDAGATIADNEVKPDHHSAADIKSNGCATQVFVVAPTRRATSAARAAASRANARKSTGPRTAVGKRRSSRNALQWRSPRLLGEVESRRLGQEPGAAQKLYRELIAPYERPGEPAPPLLAMHFQDLARLWLELEAWERIRDARIEERWRQADIKLRRRLHNLQQDLHSTPEEVFEKGLAALPESPARARQQVQCLWMLRHHLESRDFDVAPFLEKLYGQKLNPLSDRAQTICIRCNKLMHPEEHETLSDQQFQDLIGLVALEQQEAATAYGLYLDDTSLPDSARVASLSPTKRDGSMALEGTRLRQAIDRKQWVITGLLQTLGLHHRRDSDPGAASEPKNPPPPPRSNLSKTKLRSSLKSVKQVEKRAKTNLRKPEKTAVWSEKTREFGKTKLRARSVVERPLLGFKDEKVVSKPRAKVRSSKDFDVK